MAFGAAGWRTRFELLIMVVPFVLGALCHGASSSSSAATATKHHDAHDTSLYPFLPHHFPLSQGIRGGASVSSKGNANAKNNKKLAATSNTKDSKSVVESVTVLQVLQLRFIPWLRLLRTLSFVAWIVSSFLTYHSIGVPYAHAIWNLLHPNHTQQFKVGMPEGYLPSLNDRRIAAHLLLGDDTAFGIPPEWFPSVLETSLATVWGLVYLILQWFCPMGWQERWRAKVVPPQQDFADRLAQGQRLALLVQDEIVTIRNNNNNNNNNNTQRDKTRQICPVYPVRQKEGTSKNKDDQTVSYAFDFRKGLFRKRRWGWNPNNGKISVVS